MYCIAVDGPGGAGKSTISKLVARELQIEYIDTGAMYRACALKLTELGIPPADEEKIAEILEDTSIDFVQGDIILDDVNVNEEIRKPEMSQLASTYSAIPCVRTKLVELQRQMGKSKSVIMDGRDIGTNVFPDAEIKIYLTADAEERARRRYLEQKEKGMDVTFEEVLRDINQRDYNDSHRALNPLRKAEDAWELDTTRMSIEEVVKTICDYVHETVTKD